MNENAAGVGTGTALQHLLRLLERKGVLTQEETISMLDDTLAA